MEEEQNREMIDSVCRLTTARGTGVLKQLQVNL